MNKSVYVLIAVAFSYCAIASELPTATPEDVGMSGERLQKVSDFMEREIDAELSTGMVTMVARYGKIVHFAATGKYGLDNDKAIEKDTIFRIYSMTKPITTVAAMMLYEEGHFQLDDPVSKFLPEFADQHVLKDGERMPVQSEMTIEQLMIHTAGLSYDFNPQDAVDASYRESQLRYAQDLDEFVSILGQLPLRYEPGTKYHYSFATDVLGAIIERISGSPLDEFFQQRIFDPLEMDDTFFNVPDAKLDRVATLHVWNAEDSKMILMPDNTGRPIREQGITFFSGGGGLFSTAMDYMVFCEMLRRGGTFNGVRILGPKTVQFMAMNHLKDEVIANLEPPADLYHGQYFGLGFGVMVNPGVSEVITSKGELSWGGAADTKFLIDPQEEIVGISMSQLLLYPRDSRYPFKVAIYQSLTELNRERRRGGAKGKGRHQPQ